MCFSSPEYDVEFANKAIPRRRTKYVAVSRPAQTRISETVVWERKPPVEYVPGPRSSLPPLVRTVTPPKPLALLPAPAPESSLPEALPAVPSPPATSTPPAEPTPATRLELVSVVESSGDSPRASRTSVTGKKKRHSRDEVYIERERETVRVDPRPRPSKDIDVFQYIEQPSRRDRRVSLESGGRRSITYEANPRMSSRTIERERERVIIEDGGRRREYYRKV